VSDFALFEHLPDPAWLENEAGLVRMGNRAFTALVGHGTETVPGGALPVEELDLVRADTGERVCVEVVRVVLPGVGRLAVARDITQRQQTAKRLREREALFRTVSEAGRAFAWEIEVNPEGEALRFVFVDGAVEDVLGLPAADVLRLMPLTGIPAQHFPRVSEQLRRVVRDRLTLFGIEYPVYLRDRQVRWLLGDWVPVVDADGQVRRVHGATRDITTRKALADALQERSLQLDARLREARVLFEVSMSLGDFTLTCTQAARVVAVCLPMAFEQPERVQVAVMLGLDRVGDDSPAAGWPHWQGIELDGQPIGHIGVVCMDAPVQPDPVLLEALARELTRWYQRRNAAEQLRHSEARLRSAQRAAGLGSWWSDPVGDRIVLSESACAMFGLPAGSQLDVEALVACVAERDRARLRRHWRTAQSFGMLDIELRLHSDTSDIWLHLCAEMACDSQGRLLEINGTVRDISERKRGEERMRLSARIFDSASESIVVTNPCNEIVAVNAAFTRISGHEACEVLGRNPGLLGAGRLNAAFFQRMWHALRHEGSFQGEFWNRAKDGRIYPLLQTITVLRDSEGQITHYVGIGADLSHLRQAEARTDYLSNHDALTDLPNRQAIGVRVAQSIAVRPPSQSPSVQAALLVIGLDGFKSINDSMGHAAGDAVLIEMAARLRPLVDQGLFVGRLGGDEFVVLLERTGREHCVAVVRELLGSLSAPLSVEGHELTLTVSAGISLFPGDGLSSDVLLRNAESALNGAKDDGRNTWRFYDPQMNQASLERLILVSALRRGVAGGELRAWYQPKLDLQTREVIGAEALVRWKHQDQGWIQPARFIPVAEQSDLIAVIGEWMLREVAAQIAHWHGQGRGWLPVAVNLGARHFGDPSLPVLLRQLRAEHGLPPNVLELEITESTLMDAGSAPDQLLGELRRAGVTLAIDDFGTGYSSLSYLKHLPVDVLKIDRSFVSSIERDGRDLSIAGTIIALAHGLGLKVVAEGVETEGQRVLLESLGCDQGQGWLYARPMPAAEFDLWRQVWGAPQLT
jgi:two-component system CheB/CheR fusion protein